MPLVKVYDLLNVTVSKEIKQRVFVELPKYISELSLADWKSVIEKLHEAGYKRFVVSNISQLPLLPSDSIVAANENVYLMNDIASNFARSENIKYYCYPVETDYPNLISGRDRGGIIPIYFHPDLFYSRQPIVTKEFSDEHKTRFCCSVEAGFTVVSDSKAVSWTQNVAKFRGKGFCRFLIDISFDNELERLPEIVLAVKNSAKMPNTIDFNMKKGLK